MVIQIPAEALLANFKAQVGAGRYSVRLGKSINNHSNSNPTFRGDLPGHFEWRLIRSFVHHHSHPSRIKRMMMLTQAPLRWKTKMIVGGRRRIGARSSRSVIDTLRWNAGAVQSSIKNS
jgi:hypothetical protein